MPSLSRLEGGPRTERRKVEMTPLEEKGGSESNGKAHWNQRESKREREREKKSHLGERKHASDFFKGCKTTALNRVCWHNGTSHTNRDKLKKGP